MKSLENMLRVTNSVTIWKEEIGFWNKIFQKENKQIINEQKMTNIEV